MGWIHDEIGRAVGLPREIGGIPLDEIGATGFGLAVAIETAGPTIGLDLKGARFAVQGFGSVGMHAARRLAAKGAVLVAASDSKGTIANPDGLDVEALIGHKGKGGSLRDYGHGQAGERDVIVEVACDIWIPAARPDVIHAGNVARLRTKLVAQGANIPCTEEAEAALAARGTFVLPDFIANAGGVICAATEFAHGTESGAFAAIEERIRRNTKAVMDESLRAGTLPRTAAVALAVARIRTAMRTRRWDHLSG